MIRQQVSSSNLKTVGYDENLHILEIEFNNFSIYQYFDVPIFIHKNLMGSSSLGRFFLANIKGKYRDLKIH